MVSNKFILDLQRRHSHLRLSDGDFGDGLELIMMSVVYRTLRRWISRKAVDAGVPDAAVDNVAAATHHLQQVRLVYTVTLVDHDQFSFSVCNICLRPSQVITLGHFTFWISLLLRLSPSPKRGLRPKMSAEKWSCCFVWTQRFAECFAESKLRTEWSLNPNFGLSDRWIQS